MAAEYELYYWPFLQGRGEFIRLVFELAGVPCDDVCRRPEEEGGGIQPLLAIMQDEERVFPSFAPPFLKCEGRLYSQTANILDFLGPRLGLAGASEFEARFALQLQLTIMDTVREIHDLHHPVSTGLYYEDQKEAALAAARQFWKDRVWRWMNYYERALRNNGGTRFIGQTETYPDLSMFQLLCGLEYAFPKNYARLAENHAALADFKQRIAELPAIAAYLKSERRLPFNEDGLFRHYPELDV